MNSSIDTELLQCFVDEALDSLTSWERACLDLEANPTQENYNTLFRSAHNLKGASRAVGLSEFGHFVHTVEDVINLLLKGQIPISASLVSLLLECQVKLVEWCDALRSDATACPDLGTIPQKLKIVFEGHSLVSGCDESERDVGTESTHQGEKNAKSGSQSIQPEDDLEKVFAAAQAEFSQAVPVSEKKVREPERVQADSLAKSPTDAAKNPKTDETIRIAAHKLDELLQLIGELSIHQQIVSEARKSETVQSRICQNALHLSHKITKDLYSKALSLRMQPVQGLFQRLERVARDVARTQNKKIALVLEGTEVELDKSVIERMTDPMTHILRNAVDHGIETAEERSATKKPEVATITLRACQDAAGVVIEVVDDGRGLNPEKLLKKAREKGLVGESQNLSVEEIQRLIFLPGFSTAETLTDISGRGVGMDVVMKAVQSLQGNIDLRSVHGAGTTFSINLPTSLSIIDALVVKVQSERYAVAMHELTEIIDLSGFTLETSGQDGAMISLRGEIVPVQRLQSYMKVSPKMTRNASAESEDSPALVVRDGTRLVAFQVDGILGQQQVVVRPLAEQFKSVSGFNGCTILGDGEPGMIISLSDIARSYVEQTH